MVTVPMQGLIATSLKQPISRQRGPLVGPCFQSAKSILQDNDGALLGAESVQFADDRFHNREPSLGAIALATFRRFPAM
jgi:hypothetical protein